MSNVSRLTAMLEDTQVSTLLPEMSELHLVQIGAEIDATEVQGIIGKHASAPLANV